MSILPGVKIPVVGDIVGGIMDLIKSGQERGLKEAEIRLRAEELVEGAITARIAAVNASIQAEARSDKWLQWAWRPIIGLIVGAVMFNNYVLLTYAQRWGAKAIPIDPEFWLFAGAVLGVAAYTRGREKEKREEVRAETARALNVEAARAESAARLRRMDDLAAELGGGR